jgi:hypothetical protein
VLPADAEPFRLGASVEEGGAVSMVRDASNPAADLVAIEGRIEPHTAVPSASEAVLRFRDVFGARQAQLLAEMQKANGGQIAGRQKIDGGRAQGSLQSSRDLAVLHAAHLVGSQRDVVRPFALDLGKGDLALAQGHGRRIAMSLLAGILYSTAPFSRWWLPRSRAAGAWR